MNAFDGRVETDTSSSSLTTVTEKAIIGAEKNGIYHGTGDPSSRHGDAVDFICGEDNSRGLEC